MPRDFYSCWGSFRKKLTMGDAKDGGFVGSPDFVVCWGSAGLG